MTHTKCDNCGEEFPEEEIENHRLRCIYTINNKELENLIPCEVCNQLINFESYHQHLLTCYQPAPPPLNTNNFPRLERETYSDESDTLSRINRIIQHANLLTEHIRGVNSYLNNNINDYHEIDNRLLTPQLRKKLRIEIKRLVENMNTKDHRRAGIEDTLLRVIMRGLPKDDEIHRILAVITQAADSFQD